MAASDQAGAPPGWDGDSYARRIDKQLAAVEAAGGSRHGEADLVMSLRPSSALDAGCGTGRVALELERRGIEVTGVDADASMLRTAQASSTTIRWIHADLVGLDLGVTFDVVFLAGNVPLFTPPGTEHDLVLGGARHVAPGGHLIAGFQLDGRYSLDAYDASCATARLELIDRWATWDCGPFTEPATYAVSLHHRAPSAARVSRSR